MNGKTIKIAGAGIAGITAAINLAKAGYNVEIYERSEVTGKRFHGDFQGIDNWSFEQDALDFLKQANIETNFNHPGYKYVSIWGPDGFKKNVISDKPFFYLVKRGTNEGCLDFKLQKQVKNNQNIKVNYEKKIDHKEVDIIASGPFFNDPNTDGIVDGLTFKTNLNDCAILIFDDKYAPDGYSYFLVNSHFGVIATCIFKRFNKSIEYFDKTVKLCKKNIDFEMQNIKQFSGTGNFFLGKIPPNKKIYVGEAGGNQDYLWGFGMRYAMLTGYLAAKSIINNQNYYALYQKEVLPRLKVSISNRLIFKLLGRKSYKLFVKHFTNSPDPRLYLGKFYRPSLLKTLVYPLARTVYSKHIRDPRQFS